MRRRIIWLLVTLLMFVLVSAHIADAGTAALVVLFWFFVAFPRVLRFLLGMLLIFRGLAS